MNIPIRRSHTTAPRRAVAVLAVSIAVLLAGHAGRAATWDGGGADNNFTTAANWVGNVAPVTGEVLAFDGNFRLAPVNNEPAAFLIGGLTFSTSAGAFVLTPATAANTLTLGGNIVNNSLNAQASSIPLILNATREVSVASTRGSLSLTGVISQTGGAFGITKMGSGLLTLAGAANTYTGQVSINGGTLGITTDTSTNGAAAPLGAAPAAVVSNAIVISGGALRAANTFVLNSNRGIVLGSGAAGSGGTLDISSGTTLTYTNGVIANNGGTNTLTKTGAGGVTLSGASTYTGGTNINHGAVLLTFNAGSQISNILYNGSVTPGALTMGGASTALGGNQTITTINFPKLDVRGKDGTIDRAQSVGGLTLKPGVSLLTVTNGTGNSTTALNVGAITHEAGGVVEFAFASGTTNTVQAGSGGVATNGFGTTASNTNNILGGWATFASNSTNTAFNHNTGTDWATVDANGNIVAYAHSVAETFAGPGGNLSTGTTAASNVTLAGSTTSTTLNAGVTDLNTIRITGGNAQIIEVGAGNNLRLGTYGGFFRNNAGGATTIGASTATGGTLTAGGPSANSPGEIVFNSILSSIATTAWTVNSAITNNPAGGAVSVTNAGNNALVLANSANSYSGGTFILQGRVTANSSTAFGTGTVHVSAGAYAYLNSGSTWTNNFNIAGLGGETSSNGAIRFQNGAFVLGNATSTLTLSGDSRIGGVGGMILSQITGDYSLDFSTGGGGSVFTLSDAANDFGGHLTVNGANNDNALTVRIGAAGALPDGTGKGNVIINGGTTAATNSLDLNGFDETINGLASGANGTRTRVTNNSTANSAAILRIGNADATATFAGVIQDGTPTKTVALNKTGAGTQTLTGANTYTGPTTIDGGTLVVSGSISGGTVAVNSTGTLAGGTTATPGSITNAVNVNAGGTIAPGASIGTLNTGTLSLASTGTFALEIDTTSSLKDLVAITGNFNLSDADDAVLTISDLNPAEITSGTFAFITYSGSWDGDFFTYNGNVIADGGLLTVGANQFTLAYDFGGNSVALLAIPEPSAALSLLGGVGMLLGLRRRRATRSTSTNH